MSPPQTRRRVVRRAASALALGLGGCAGRTDAAGDESPDEPTSESPTLSAKPTAEPSGDVGSIVLRNSDSSAHELNVAVKRYGEVIYEESHVLETGSRERIPLREPGSYSITVELDGETVSKRESFTATNRCREWRLSFGVSSDGKLENSRGMLCLQ